MTNLNESEILILVNGLDCREPGQEEEILKIIRKSSIEDIDNILLKLTDLRKKDKADLSMLEDLFFFFLVIYIETNEEWRLTRIYNLLHHEMKTDKIGLRHFLNLYINIIKPAEALRLSFTPNQTWQNTKIKASDIGVLLHAHATQEYGTKISQETFRSYRSALIVKVSKDLMRLATEKNQYPLTK